MRSDKFIYILFAVIFARSFISTEAQVKVTDGSVLTMDPNSLLELESTNKGLLIPRMAINNLNQAAPLTAPVPVGMLVYSIGGTVIDGFYYWTGTIWKRFVQSIVQVNEGGTGLSSGISGGILGFTGTTTIASSSLLAQNAVVIGGGAGATPSTLTIGPANMALVVNTTGTGYTHRTIKQLLGTFGVKDVQDNVSTPRQFLIVASGGTSQTEIGSRIIQPFAGRIIGIMASASRPFTSGTATISVFKNNSSTTVTVAISSTGSTQYAYTSTGSELFNAGDVLDLRVSSNDIQPDKPEIIGWIIVEWTE